MSSLDEHYQILDASPTASLEEIRLLYRDLAQVWHPDRFQENPRLREKAEAKLQSINTAYEAIRKRHGGTNQERPPRKRETPARSRSTPSVPQDEADALGWYAKAAAEGHADAQCIIATMYAGGESVAIDEAKAVEWFKRSAAQGHPAAEFQIGLRYYSGRSLPKDPKRAFTYYQRAALQGHAKAQFNLGIMHTNGQYVSRDNVSAFAWFTIAAENDHPDAPTLRDSVADYLVDPEREQAHQLVARPETTDSTVAQRGRRLRHGWLP